MAWVAGAGWTPRSRAKTRNRSGCSTKTVPTTTMPTPEEFNRYVSSQYVTLVQCMHRPRLQMRAVSPGLGHISCPCAKRWQIRGFPGKSVASLMSQFKAKQIRAVFRQIRVVFCARPRFTIKPNIDGVPAIVLLVRVFFRSIGILPRTVTSRILLQPGT